MLIYSFNLDILAEFSGFEPN